MFERRLKWILIFLLLATAALMARAAQIQLAERARWEGEADNLLTQRQLVETTRGSILDCNGKILAADEPCIDACVEYPAISEDWNAGKNWLHAQAVASAQRRLGQGYSQATRAKQKLMIADEEDRVKGQVHAMWEVLADAGGQSDQQIEEIRQSIVRRVEARRQSVMLHNYRKVLARHLSAKPSWYERLWPGAGVQELPPIDETVVVVEEEQSHVILPAIKPEVYTALARQQEDLPGLVLRPGRQRVYPYNEAACHLIGTLATANFKPDPYAGDELRDYWPNDRAGAGGVELASEAVLRGTRGEMERTVGDEDWQTVSEAVPGANVTLSIDIELEKECEAALAKARVFRVPKLDGDVMQSRKNQPGAVVVIDLASGRPLALASFPNYDLKTFRDNYAKLLADQINEPLMDRALSDAREPGSTVKPLMAMAALTEGIITPQFTVQCDGYLVIDGHRQTVGRCWTMSEFGMTHMQVPSGDPMPTDEMTVVDAIERSCNVYFETVADMMGMARQRTWYDRFGLGRPAGVGLPENAGHIPDPAHTPPALLKMTTWFTGIGQQQVAATPVQMASAVAAIARGGRWVQPRLIVDGVALDTRDLGFSATALAAVKEGMEAVANKAGGTGHPYGASPAVARLRIAAKTGTPQVPHKTIRVKDSDGKERWVAVNPDDPAATDWYLADDAARTHYAHNWYIGYAPADHPKIAFAVLAEYGGTGSPTASAIAADVLDACIRRGYLN